MMLREGRKRQVRRMCEAVGHRVIELERVAFGPLGLRGLGPGESRRLAAARSSGCAAPRSQAAAARPPPDPAEGRGARGWKNPAA